MNALPDFFSAQFLTAHIRSILKFYDPIVDDPTGGYFQNYQDNGNVIDKEIKQLVSSTRIVVNYATAYHLFDKDEYKLRAAQGINFIEEKHWIASEGNYAWTLLNNKPDDMTQQAYGYAFVLLAYAALQKYGVKTTSKDISRLFDLLEERFWQSAFGLYADEISPEGELSAYRGQNANMHLCEAMLMAYEATNDNRYLDRAETIANNICFRQADITNGLVWEHYTLDFVPDWDYNKSDPKNLYRPWGFQPGHQTEWSKLLLGLNRYRPASRYVEKAQRFFDRSYAIAWDKQHGGLIYGFDPDFEWCDDDKYFWVQAESLAAAAMLYSVTQDKKYLNAYTAIWTYAWQHLVDHEYGAWFRVLTRDNKKISDVKSSAGAKCDYHTLCACADILRVIGQSDSLQHVEK